MQNNILICDSNPDTIDILKERLLSDETEVFTTDSGEEAVKMINSGNIHIVVTDLILRQVDGLKVLEHTKRMSPDIPVIVLSDGHPGKLVRKINEMGADYVLLKDNLEILYERVRFIRGEIRKKKRDNGKFHEHVITEMLNETGLNHAHKGFRITAEAIRMCIHDDRYHKDVTKRLYPELSEIFAIRADCIEKSMRDAINFAWNGQPSLIHDHFRIKPTNREFITRIAVMIRRSEERMHIAE